MPRKGKVWIGASGWVYKHWRNGVFYPKGLPVDEQLAYYADQFSTVEVNNTFYRLPERDVFESWREQTPKAFLFAVKASRYLTHMKKLNEPEEPIERLMDHASGLKEKLGPILFQFPHTWPVHVERLEPFLKLIRRRRGKRFAFEFRHKSWLTEEVYKLLEEADAALCMPLAPGMPIDERLTTSWTYIRFHHGTHEVGFTAQHLAAWAKRIRSLVRKGVDVYAYFNNDAEGHAIRDAQRLRELLGEAAK